MQNECDSGAGVNGEPRRARRPLTVRKPKATAGWTEGGGPTEAPKLTSIAQEARPAVAAAPPMRRREEDDARGRGKAGQSAAERAGDLRSAYRARMAAMRTSRVGGARRQAREMPEPEAEAAPSDSAAEQEQTNGATVPALRLSRSQRKRLARSARSTAVLDAALVRAGVANPVSRAALADAIASGIGDGDQAMGERISRALTS
jgi:hypothetical protein